MLTDGLPGFVLWSAALVEALGVGVIVLGVIASTAWFGYRALTRGALAAYGDYRQALGRAILLGLELLVAADIIRSVATPTLEGVLVLAIIVLIRTFLSMTLELELEGHWPWQRGRKTTSGAL